MMRSCSCRRAVRGAFSSLALLCLSLLAGSAGASRSSYSPSRSGSKVFFLLIQDLGYQVTRGFDPRAIDPATKLLVVIGLPESREHARLLEWVRRGGTLLLAPPLDDDGGFCKPYHLGSLEVARGSGLLGWIDTAVSHPDLRLRASTCLLRAPTAATVLAGRPDRALALELQAGRGRVLVLAHEDLLANEGLDRDDVAVLIRRWLARHLEGGARVTFLEEKRGGQLLDLLRSTHLGPLVLHALLWLLLLYWMITPRFGDAFPEAASTRRAFAQHARALGALYRHRGASAHMLRQQLDRFLARLTGRPERRLGTGRRSEGRVARPALAAIIATRTGRDTEAVESLLAQLDAAMRDPRAGDPKQTQRHFRLSQALAALQRVSATGPYPRGGSRARKGRPGIR